jgi:hypothetical protein
MGGTRGDASYCLTAKQVNYDGTRGTDGSLAFTVGAVANGIAPDWGQTLTSGKETHSVAGVSASRDDAATTGYGLVAVLSVVSVDSGTPTVKIQQSSDDGVSDAFAEIVSFAAVAAASAPTAQRLTISGAVLRYLRVTTTGTFSNCAFVVTTPSSDEADQELLERVEELGEMITELERIQSVITNEYRTIMADHNGFAETLDRMQASGALPTGERRVYGGYGQ